MANEERKTGQIKIFAKNIRGNASGGILEEAKYIKNIAGGKHIQNGGNGVNNGKNLLRKEALKVVKVEGPFDENNKLVDSIEKGKWYNYKAKFNRTPEKGELKMLKWASEYDESGSKNLLVDVLNREKDDMAHQVLTQSTNLRLRIYAYFQNQVTYAKAEIMQGEILFIVGTEQHSQTYGNKLMFPAQAVREIRQNFKDHKHANIIIFKDEFTEMQLNIIKRDARIWNKNLYFKRISSVSDLIGYINNGDSTINRNKNKLSIIKIFSHGLPSVLDFGLDGDNEESQRFKIEHVSQLKKESFSVKPEIYSYACRTGNSDGRLVAYNDGYKYDAESIKLVKPEESLAQKFANQLDAKVYAYLKRSNYTSSWLDGGDKKYTKDYITIEDENVSNPLNIKDWFRKGWDEALWNKAGAYLPPTSGKTPGGILEEGLFVFEKDKKAKKK